ncbi:MAG TPA: hypothetical protein VK778_06065 [Solirubrobacteraceae bacterium]|jgi:hypothetical protein|nr:hypothetical protein [Solirubrobacteraceae bacterium]
MTAEIAVMNQSAVALAADSAATRSGAKIFSANKIFALSKYEPVAVMVYGNAACMRVPWETIIKEYRAELSTTSYSHVKDYGQSFLDFMGKDRALFPESEQERFAYESSQSHFVGLRQEIIKAVQAQVETGTPIALKDVRAIVSKLISETLERWEAVPIRVGIKKSLPTRLRQRYKGQIDQAIKDVFENLPLTKKHADQLCKIAVNSWCSGLQTGLSGIVFAGFGRNQVFPALKNYELDGVLLNEPVYWHHEGGEMTHATSAWIVPFAQQDMIRLFVEGVTPRYGEFIEAYFRRTLAGLDKVVGDALPKSRLTPAVEKRLAAEREKLTDSLQTDLRNQRQELYVNPLLSIVGSLPMDELASLAESLVNLTSLRRRVSLDDETVGGPIDVAVISRGDGLVWIKRKHYFPADLNHQFFTNYNRSDHD